MLTRKLISKVCFLAFVFSANFMQVNAKTFVANDFASYNTAVGLVNAGAGGDTIKITGNIIDLEAYSERIENDITIIGETNPDGTPKYTVTARYEAIYCWVKNYIIIENLIIESHTGISIIKNDDIGYNTKVRIHNCVVQNCYGYGGIEIRNHYATHPTIEITDCMVNNNSTGIEIIITGEQASFEKCITISNCVANNNNGGGIRVYWAGYVDDDSAVIAYSTYLSDCIANDNGSEGISIARGSFMTNCTANRNGYHGILTGAYPSKMLNCIATENTGEGIGTSVHGSLYAENCIAIANTEDGFWCSNWTNILNNCAAIDNGKGGFKLGDASFVTNSSAINNNSGDGGMNAHGGVFMNCTAFLNKNYGISSGNCAIYNSISFNNGEWDIESFHNVSKFRIYNSVYGATERILRESTINCTNDDPQITWTGASVNRIENPAEAPFYTLGNNSSAQLFSSKDIINRAVILERLDGMFEYVSENVKTPFMNWMHGIITDAYLDSIVKFDQTGNTRTIIDSRYDAGSIVSNTIHTNTKRITTYSPKEVANYGKCVVKFYGSGFDENTKFTLKRQGEKDVPADTIAVNYTQCDVVFNVHNKKVGLWEIEVDFGDKITTLTTGLRLQEYIKPVIDVEVFPGLDSIYVRPDENVLFTIKYTNKGNVDAYVTPILVTFINNFAKNAYLTDVTPLWDWKVYEDPAIESVPKILSYKDKETGVPLITIIPPVIPRIPANGTGYLNFNVRFSATLEYQGEKIATGGPMNMVVNCLQPMLALDPASIVESDKMLKSANASQGFAEGFMLEVGFSECFSLLGDAFFEALGILATPLGCIKSALDIAYRRDMNELNDVEEKPGSFGADMANMAMNCIPMAGGAVQIGASVALLATGTSCREMSRVEDQLGFPISQLSPCGWEDLGYRAGMACNKPDGFKIYVIDSWDPNDKTGPTSHSGSKFINNEIEDFTYIINFENDAEALAAAREVWIRDTLDLDVFDINTFEAGPVRIGSKFNDAPPQLQNYIWTVDMKPQMNYITKVDLQLDKINGVATWHFKCIDPATGEFPTNALAGFLPPEDGDGNGQGSVMFTIKLKEDLPDDVVIANKAEIIFDRNEPIMTPLWENKRDIVPPASTMLTPTYKGNNQVELQWEGTDNVGGSGVYCYDVYVKRGEGAGEYEMIYYKKQETTALFEVESGISYSFYTIATDHADNRETKTDIPDITYTPTGIKTLTVLQDVLLTPNPAGTECTLQLGVEQAGTISINLYNMLGANVMKIYDGYVESGSFKHTFNTGSLPAGVYTVVIQATGRPVVTRKLLIIKN